MWDDYYDLIKSDVADVKNTGGRPGGTITAAAFLSKFIGKAVWAHLDIASTDWSDREKAYIPKGATGVGARLLIQFLRNRARSQKETGGNGRASRRRVSTRRRPGKARRPIRQTVRPTGRKPVPGKRSLSRQTQGGRVQEGLGRAGKKARKSGKVRRTT